MSTEGDWRLKEGGPDRSIDPRLLAAAKKEFLEKGYKMSSLAEICKAAGVTTGALYKRYEGKEDLFAALVSDTIRDMKEYTSWIEKEDLSGYSDRELYDSLSMTPESILKWMKMLEDHRDEIILLVRCAAGTRYENFHHDFSWDQIKEHAEVFHGFINLPEALGIRDPSIIS